MTRDLWHRINMTIIALLGSLITMQCAGDQQVSIDKYFDIQEFISKQVTSLKTQDATLVKILKIDGSTENRSITGLDSIQWEKEFRIFREHDINKPVLIDAYSMEEKVSEDGYTVNTYNLIDSTLSGILNVEIIIDPEGEVTAWRSIFSEENILYSNLRTVSMNFHPNGRLINGYTIHGYHKLAFKDTVFYQLQAVMEYEK